MISPVSRNQETQRISSVIASIMATAAVLCSAEASEIQRELRVGVAGHAFEHLGTLTDQAEAAAESGSTIIYPGGFGTMGYNGLGSPTDIAKANATFRAYNSFAKMKGINLAIGYMCATSIVNLDGFARNWTPDFRAKFSASPATWLQQDRSGAPLVSWYGGDYHPACMNNPDWRIYEKAVLRMQLEAGHDGIFFDNPTVHVQGCYCEHCMDKFASFILEDTAAKALPASDRLPFLRQLATSRRNDFLRFRSTTARDFLAEMRTYARSIKVDALITCNNSLNTPCAFFSQCRTLGYNIHELSKAQDWITVEDMVTQPRVLADGQIVEYGPTYELIHAIGHGKPLVACALAEGDYHTPANLVRLAMAEAAAHNASYLCWPTWPEGQRHRMAALIRPQAELLRTHETLLNGTTARRDIILFLPFRRWVDTDDCVAARLAAELSRANVQFEVVCEDDFTLTRLQPRQGQPAVLLVESLSVLNDAEKETLRKYQSAGGGVIAADVEENVTAAIHTNRSLSLTLDAPKTVRAKVRDLPERTVIHLLNLNIQRLSSFEDRVRPAEDVRITCRVPFSRVRSVRVLTADEQGTAGELQFKTVREGDETIVKVTLGALEIASIVVIES